MRTDADLKTLVLMKTSAQMKKRLVVKMAELKAMNPGFAGRCLDQKPFQTGGPK
jgi:hypothetical protein